MTNHIGYIKNVSIIVDGKAYQGNGILARKGFFGLVLKNEIAELQLDRTTEWPYIAHCEDRNGTITYDCRAKNTNGHIMNFKLKFPSKGITVVESEPI
jgi:hypothetical protein